MRKLIERAPQLETACAGLVQRLHPAWIVLYSLRRRIATGGVLVLTVWLFLHIVFGANGMVIYQQKRAEIDDMQRQIHSLQQENDRYNNQINSLKSDPRAIEREAREGLHYTRPGEVVYVAPAPVSPPKPPNNSAKR